MPKQAMDGIPLGCSEDKPTEFFVYNIKVYAL